MKGKPEGEIYFAFIDLLKCGTLTIIFMFGNIVLLCNFEVEADLWDCLKLLGLESGLLLGCFIEEHLEMLFFVFRLACVEIDDFLGQD